MQADDPPQEQQPLAHEAAVREPPPSSSHAEVADPQREASPQPSEAAQPPPGPPAVPSPRVTGWDGPLPPWRGPTAVLMAHKDRDLLVPRSLADASSFDTPHGRPLTLLFPLPGSDTAIAAVQHVTLHHAPRTVEYYIPARDVDRLLRLSGNRDSLGRLHIRVTARCSSYSILVRSPTIMLLRSIYLQLSRPCLHCRKSKHQPQI